MSDETATYNQRYTLADFFDKTFRLLRHTWKTSIIGGLVILGLPVVVLGLLWPQWMSEVVQLSTIETNTASEALALRSLVLWFALTMLATLVLVLASLWANLAVTHAARNAVTESPQSWRTNVGEAFRESFGRVIVQVILMALIGVGVFVLPTILAVISTAVQSGALGVIAALLGVAAMVISIWIFISLIFAPYAVVFDRTGIIDGMRTSFALVRGNWWRLFGISLLIGIMISFVAGLLSTPIAGAFTIPFVSDIAQLALESERMSDELILSAFEDMGIVGVGVALATIIQQLVMLLFVPVFYSLFYIDVKMRHREATSDEQ